MFNKFLITLGLFVVLGAGCVEAGGGGGGGGGGGSSSVSTGNYSVNQGSTASSRAAANLIARDFNAHPSQMPTGHTATVTSNRDGSVYVSIRPSSSGGGGSGRGSSVPVHVPPLVGTLPQITTNQSTYIVGQTATISWNPTNMISCTAASSDSSWAGAKLATNGGKTDTAIISHSGNITYNLSCTSVSGVTIKRSVTVTADYPTDLSPVNQTVLNRCQKTSCANISATFNIANSAHTVSNSTVVPYYLEYQIVGTASWIREPASNWTTGISKNTVTGTITKAITGITTYGNYQARVVVNQPANTSIGETIFSNNTSAPFNLSVAPAPIAITIKSSNTLVRYQQTTTLSWDVSSTIPFTCHLTGGGLNYTINSTNNHSNLPSPALTNKQKFLISCDAQNYLGFSLPATQNEVVVEVIPRVQEV